MDFIAEVYKWTISFLPSVILLFVIFLQRVLTSQVGYQYTSRMIDTQIADYQNQRNELHRLINNKVKKVDVLDDLRIREEARLAAKHEDDNNEML